MTKYYEFLNLPKNPLKDKDKLLNTVSKNVMPQIAMDPYEWLTDEILDIFHNLGVKPSVMVVFKMEAVGRDYSRALMHTDIIRDNNDWKIINCGINWEITDIDAELTWWETSKQAVYPVDPKYFYLNPNGIHYQGRLKFGVDLSTDIKLDSVNTLSAPLLIRTNIPHTVTIPKKESYPSQTRCCISIRFDPDFNTWEEAVDFFKPLVKA